MRESQPAGCTHHSQVALLNLGDAGVPLKIFQHVECCCDPKLDMLNLERSREKAFRSESRARNSNFHLCTAPLAGVPLNGSESSFISTAVRQYINCRRAAGFSHAHPVMLPTKSCSRMMRTWQFRVQPILTCTYMHVHIYIHLHIHIV